MAITLQGLNLQMEALTTGTLLGAFESSDAELNDFLFNDAKSYLSALLAVTFLIKSKGEAVAYFCLSNDSVIKDDEEKATWNKLNRSIANSKRRRSYPAVKIGRLAVDKKYANMGVGSFILNAIEQLYLSGQQQAGCRFITVDAYSNALGFYEKNGFTFLTDKDKTSATRAMYLDLKSVNS